jgi:tetratricopeptide (TPR) repeat protein
LEKSLGAGGSKLALASRFLLALLVLAAVGVSAGIAAGAALVVGLTQPVAAVAATAVAAVVAVLAPFPLGRALADSSQRRFDVRDALAPAYKVLSRAEAQAAPNLLLRPLYEATPFRGRADQSRALAAWCAADRVPGLALIHGPGGMGKSRLAAKLCRTQLEQGWLAGFLKPDLAPEVISALAALTKPVLIVVDYAETRPDTVTKLIDTLTEKRTRKRWRVLLVARTTGDWWPYLPTQVHGEAEAVVKTATTYELPAIEPSLEGRQAAFEEAAGHFGRLLDRSSEAIGEPDLSDRRFDRPLWLHMAALSALFKADTGDAHKGGPVSASPDGPLEDALLREHEYWRKTVKAAEAANGTRLDIDDGLAARAVAVATLLGAANGAEAEEALRAVGSDTMDRRRVADWLRTLYPGGREAWFHPLEPDLLGEALLAKTLNDAPGVIDRALRLVPPERAERPLTVLNRIAHKDLRARAALERCISTRLDSLWSPAFEVARGSGDPLGQILAIALERNPRAEIAESIRARLPEATVVFRELAVVATEVCLVAARERGAAPDEVARLLNNLSIRHAHLGRREAALAASEEAVSGYRALVSQRPDAFRPGLASSLQNLSTRLADLGRCEAALAPMEEAVKIRRSLVAERPDAFLGNLAGALNNLSNRLADLGRHEAALAAIEEAVKIRRNLVAERPDASRTDLAMALNTLSNRLADLGRRGAALAASEEAVSTYRALVAERPGAFLPDLARALNNLSIRLSAIGRREPALVAMEEALSTYRTLAADRPEAFLPELADALNNVSNRLADLGRHEAALAPMEEAVSTYRVLAAERPDASRTDLAMALNNLSNRLADLGRRDAALAAIEEAVTTYRDLVAERPDAFLPNLAASLNNLSVQLSDLGRRDASLAAIEEAVTTYRDLVAERPDAFRDKLVTSLRTLARLLDALGRHEEAEAATMEADGLV